MTLWEQLRSPHNLGHHFSLKRAAVDILNPRREHRRQRVERGVHRASRPCRRTRGSARSLDARLPRARAASEPTAIHDDFHGSSPLAPQSFELRTRGQLKREEERSRGDASGSEFAYDLLRLVGFFDLRDSH